MDSRQCYISIHDGVYGSWRAIGELEDLATDGDVAQFLVALYWSLKQRDREECSIKCVHCHCPLTLYCNTCQRPSHLATPTQPPPPSLSSPPPALSSQLLPNSSHLPVLMDTAATDILRSDLPVTDVLQSDTLVTQVKGEQEDGAASPPEAEGDDDSEACSYDLDIVKTESSVSGCDQESRSTEPIVNFRLMPSTGVRRRSTRTSSRRKPVVNSDQAKKKRRRTSSTHQNKTRKRKLRDKSQRTTDKLVTDVCFEDIKGLREDDSDLEPVTKKDRSSQNNAEDSCDDLTEEKLNQSRKKRKPCASQDLEEGHIIPVDERRLAQIHVYDDSYFDRHKIEDDPLRRPGRRKKKRANQVVSAKVATKKRGRKKLERKCVTSTDSDSNSDEEMAEDEVGNTQTNHRSLTSSRQRSAGGLRPPTDDDRTFTQNLDGTDCKDDMSSPSKENSTENGDPDDSDKQSFRILVSAQKILPLRTPDGNYARLLYSYFECAHCKKAFVHKRAFNSHVQTHVGQNLYGCAMCEQGFECSCDKVKHENRPTLQCEMCGVHLKSLYALRFHIAAIHKNDRPFKCTLCEKSFVLKTKLNTHMKYKHAEGGRLFHCDQCSYRAFDARGLKVHQMCVHSKERPFKCTYCPSAFAIKFYLDVHLRKHTGEKPFRCSECSQTFAQRPSLTRHRRTHHSLEPSGNRTVESQNAP